LSSYIEFMTKDGGSILVEVEDDDALSETGEQKAGLFDKAKVEGNKVVGVAKATFEEALQSVIGHTVGALLGAVQSLAKPPTEIEMTFGLKGTGELSNLAVGKLGAEMNYQVKLAWKQMGSATVQSLPTNPSASSPP
jgi:hypothetical protein